MGNYLPATYTGFRTFHLAFSELDVHQVTLNVDITN
jgi:hypothetical protein